LRKTRLTYEDVEKIIYLLYNTEIDMKTIAKNFNVSFSNIQSINSGKFHKKFSNIYPIRDGKISRNSYLNILMDIDNHLPIEAIAKKNNFSTLTVRRIMANRYYKYNY
jgi:hypothetical protein